MSPPRLSWRWGSARPRLTHHPGLAHLRQPGPQPRRPLRRVGAGLSVDVVGGSDFPSDLTPYDLVIQCGACMFNRKYVLNRVSQSKSQGVPMSNYGIVIAYLNGILGDITLPE